MSYIPQQYHPTYPPPNAHSPTLTSHPQSEHADHNAWPRFPDPYYHGMISGNDPYHPSLPAPTFYLFYPPTPLWHVPAPSPIQTVMRTPHLGHKALEIPLEATRRCMPRILHNTPMYISWCVSISFVFVLSLLTPPLDHA